MEENKKESESNWLNKLKEGLSNPNADIWKEKQKKDLWEPDKEEDSLFDGQKKFEKIEMTPELQNILDKKRIENLTLKAEEDIKRNQLAEKERADHDKKIKAFQKKANAEKKKLDEKVNAFQNTLNSKGIRGFNNPQFDEKSGLVLTEVTRPYKVVFDNNGTIIVGADEIVFGDNGLFYTHDKIVKSICLYHYNSVESKLEPIAHFESIKNLQKAFYKQDPQKKLGFSFFMDYNLQKEADEEIRISKLTPAERLKEEKERKEKETEAKKAQKKLENEKKQKANLSSSNIDEEFDKLFGL
jgi:hypothetical protein